MMLTLFARKLAHISSEFHKDDSFSFVDSLARFYFILKISHEESEAIAEEQ